MTGTQFTIDGKMREFIVDDLITILQMLPKDYKVILASDGEGNNYAPLYKCVIDKVIFDDLGFGELSEYEEGSDSVILFPMS